MNKGTLLLDVDGPLFDTTTALILAVNERLDGVVREGNSDWKVPTSAADVTDFAWDRFFGKRAWTEALDLMEDASFWRGLVDHVVPGARAAVRAFREAGLHVVFVSSPWVSCSEWEHARRWALLNAFGTCNAGDSKHTVNLMSVPHALKRHVHGHAFVDDRPGAAAEWAAQHENRRGFLWDAPWNHNDVNRNRDRLIDGWTEGNVHNIADAASTYTNTCDVAVGLFRRYVK